MVAGIYPNAVFRPTANFGYPQGTHNQMAAHGFCDHIASGSKATVDTPRFWESVGTSAHFIVGKDGSVSQFVNLFDVAYAQGLVSANLDRDNPIIEAALSRGNGLQPYHGDNTNRFYSVDGDGCNVFNRSFIGIEHAGMAGDLWTPALLQADIALKRWIVQELTVAGKAFARDGMDRLIGHFLLDPVQRAECPGPNWPRKEIWAAITAPGPAGVGELVGVKVTGTISQQPNLRAGPGTAFPVLQVLDPGTRVDVLGESGDYVQVRFQGQTGFVYRDFVQINP